ncbi:alpha/beta hydrolase [Patescibacteria group bacterium]|nr:alpha/beta hydrolase [Patescibacteria group bacterium]
MSNVCRVTEPGCEERTFIIDIDGDNFLNWHDLSISYGEDMQYNITFDDELLFTSVATTRKPRQIMLGTPEITSGATWPIFEIDYVRVTSGIGGGGDSRTPIVVLPGLGGSWDFGAILNGGEGSNWEIPDFVDVYDNLIASFENDGYVVDTDLFIFAYDWRKNLDTLADELKLYLENLGLTDKVNLVGHSMGGLVARSYLQKHGSDDKTNKLVTAGSPHLGAADTYPIWEGATVIDRPWWQKSAIELLTRLNRQAGENKVTTVRRLVPAVKDLLPTYDYLILDGVLKPWDGLAQYNDYLYSINDISIIDSLVQVMAGTGVSTKHQINAVTRGYKDVMAGKWEDGKALSFATADGDGTVWHDSAWGGFASGLDLEASHADIISSEPAITNIFTELGLDTSKVISSTNPDIRDSVLAVILRSPGTLEVCEEAVCNSSLGWYFPSYKLFLLPGFTGQDIDVKVLEESGLGDYDLHVGELTATKEEWKKIEGKLTDTGQQDSYQVTSSGGQLQVSQGGVTAQNGLEVTADALELVEPGWDEEDNVSKVIDESLSILERLIAVRKIRYSLMEVVKAGTVEPALRVWISLDRFMEELLTNDTYINADQVSRQVQAVPHYKQGTESKLMSSSSFYSGEFLGEADGQGELAGALGAGQETLKLDKLHSARYLYLLSLELRN